MSAASETVAALLPIPGAWVVQGGAVGVLGMGVLMILTGWLVPRRTHRDIVDSLRAERDLWRQVALKSMGHTDVLLPAAQIATEVARALSDQTAAEQAIAGRGDQR